MAKFDMATFAPKLQGMCADALASNRSPEDAADMIEAQISALAFTIALATEGNAKRMNNMIEGAAHYLTVRCSDHQRAGQVLGHLAKGGR